MTPLSRTFKLYKELKQHQIRAKLVDLPGAPHTLSALDGRSRASVIAQLLAFLDQVYALPDPWS
jgi:dipeptidyl aminopeptidase/acylaminoacyl peptidase